MANQEVPHFTNGLESLNNFFALPAFWQPIVFRYLVSFVHRDLIKTRQEIEPLEAERDAYIQAVADKTLSEELLNHMSRSSKFADEVVNHLAGTIGLYSYRNHEDLHTEQEERHLKILLTKEFFYLSKILEDLKVESIDDFRSALVTLRTFVFRFSEDERDEIAQEYRGNLPPVK